MNDGRGISADIAGSPAKSTKGSDGVSMIDALSRQTCEQEVAEVAPRSRAKDTDALAWHKFLVSLLSSIWFQHFEAAMTACACPAVLKHLRIFAASVTF